MHGKQNPKDIHRSANNDFLVLEVQKQAMAPKNNTALVSIQFIIRRRNKPRFMTQLIVILPLVIKNKL